MLFFYDALGERSCAYGSVQYVLSKCYYMLLKMTFCFNLSLYFTIFARIWATAKK